MDSSVLALFNTLRRSATPVKVLRRQNSAKTGSGTCRELGARERVYVIVWLDDERLHGGESLRSRRIGAETRPERDQNTFRGLVGDPRPGARSGLLGGRLTGGLACGGAASALHLEAVLLRPVDPLADEKAAAFQELLAEVDPGPVLHPLHQNRLR